MSSTASYQPITRTEMKNFATPDDVRSMDNAHLELLNVAGNTIARFTLKPGWRWSTAVKPIAGTDLCEIPHFQYQVSGRMHVRMADGTEFDILPGQVTAIAAGHDAWVVGDENVVAVDWANASDYGTRS